MEEIESGKQNSALPALPKRIDGDKCFDISMVAEGDSPERFLPEEIKVEAFGETQRKICLKCAYHPK